MPNDPLEDLLLDSAAVDRNRLAKGLRDIIGVDSKSGKVIVKPGFSKLTSSQKVLAFLLGVKVAFLLEKADHESIAVKDIVNETGIPRGTVAPKLRVLLGQRLISQIESGEYYVASHQILNSINQLQVEEENG